MIATKYLIFAYLAHVHAYLQKEPIWGGEPSEEFMRAVEVEYADGISEQGADDFRRHLLGYLGHLLWTNKPLRWDFNQDLVKAITKLIAKSQQEHQFMDLLGRV